MKRPRFSRTPVPPKERVNGKIRAREVRVIGPQGSQIGILSLHEAISLARGQTMDLVEVAPNANPPVCRIVDYGKYRYEQSKKEKDSKKQQVTGRVKEIQLRPAIDEHDFRVKVGHAIEFLCEDHKVKLNLRYRGREMAHPEIGLQVVDRFIQELAQWGASPEPPRKAGRNVNAIINPLPRNKRAPNPRENAADAGAQPGPSGAGRPQPDSPRTAGDSLVADNGGTDSEPADAGPAGGFNNNPFDQLDGRVG